MTATTAEPAEPAAGYYGKPIVRPHIWKDAIGWYFFTGGLAGASSVIAAAAESAGNPTLARHARRASMIGLLPSPVLLIVDLGRPARFYNMLRVFKASSPMSVGSWLLMAYSPLSGGSWLLGEAGRLPLLRRLLGLGAGIVGPSIATYTAVLVADTATPAWHEAKGELPFVFAASATASGAAMTNVLTTASGAPSSTMSDLAAGAALVEVAAATVMKRRLGPLDSYGSPEAKPWDRAAVGFSLTGAAATFAGRRSSRWSRIATLVGSAAILAGSLCERMAVVRAGTASAADPNSVLTQQRSR